MWSFVIEAFIALKACRQPRRVVRIGDIAGGAWHAGPAAPASLVAAPGTVIMRLANPIGVLTTGCRKARCDIPRLTIPASVTLDHPRSRRSVHILRAASIRLVGRSRRALRRGFHPPALLRRRRCIRTCTVILSRRNLSPKEFPARSRHTNANREGHQRRVRGPLVGRGESFSQLLPVWMS